MPHVTPHTIKLLLGNKSDLIDKKQVSQDTAKEFAEQ